MKASNMIWVPMRACLCVFLAAMAAGVCLWGEGIALAQQGSTRGRLICVDDRPFTNAPVVVELRYGGVIEQKTNITDAAGNFAVVFSGGALAVPGEFRVYSTACPSEEWSFPTTNRFGNLSNIVARQCTASVRPPPTMVLCLPFDDRPGPITANVIGGNGGTLFESNTIAALSGGPTRATGLIGGALRFDGINDMVSVPSYPAVEIGTNEFSILGWIKLEANEARARVIVEHFDAATSRGYSFRLDGGATNRLALQIANGFTNTTYLSSLRIPADGLWHHVGATLRRGGLTNLQFYLDGVADSPGSTVPQPWLLTPPSTNVAAIRIGARSGAPGDWFRGSMDELAVFRRALLPQEIRGVVRGRANGLWLTKACPPMTRSVTVMPPGRNGAGTPELALAPAPVSTVPVSVNIEVCNDAGTARELCVSFGPGGPSSISTGCLGAGQCVTLTVVVNVPSSGGVTKLTYYVSPGPCGSGSGYSQPHEVYVPAQTNQTSTGTWTTMAATAAAAGVVGGDGVAVDAVAANGGGGNPGGTVYFGLTNLAGMPRQYAYRMRVVNPNLVDVSGVQLSGATAGSGTIATGGQAVVSANFSFVLPDPLVVYAVLLEVNWDGRGYQAWMSADLENPVPPSGQPSIAVNAPSSAYVPRGGTATLSVSAASSHPPITYRWRKNRIPIAGTAGASPILTISNVTELSEGAYDVVVMDGAGAVISRTAWVLMTDKVRLEVVRDGDQIELRWPERLGGFAVETKASLSPGVPWDRVLDVPTLQGGYYRLSRSTSGGAALRGGSGGAGFYRLVSAAAAPPTSNCD